MGTGTKLLPKPALLIPSVSGRIASSSATPTGGEGQVFSEKNYFRRPRRHSFTQVRPGWYTLPFSHDFRTPTWSSEIDYFFSASPPRPWRRPTLDQTLLWISLLVFRTHQRTTASDFWPSPRISALTSRSRNTIPVSLGGKTALDDTSFTTKIPVYSGADALAPRCCLALLDTGSTQTSIRRDMLDRIIPSGAATSAMCEQNFVDRQWSGFGESASLRTSTSVRLSVHVLRATDESTCSIAAWSCLVPPSVMQHAALWSWMRFTTRSFGSFPRRPPDDRLIRAPTLSHHAATGLSGYVIGPIALYGGFHRATIVPSTSPCPTNHSYLRGPQ